MEPRDNPPPPPEESPRGLRGFVTEAWSGLLAAGDFFDQAILKFNRLTETNYELALQMARDGRIEDAIFRFRITLWLSPDHEPSLYNLGCLYHHKGENQKALALFRRIIKRHPDHANALYMVATISPDLLKPEMRPQRPPPGVVLEYFDNMAPYYDAMQTRHMYRLPALLHQLLRPELEAGLARRDMLDLGCGTGLCGAQFREEFANIIGVDLSPAMLEQAGRRIDRRGVKIYNRLVQQDIRHYLYQPDVPRFDVVTAMAVAPYLGELTLLIRGVMQVLRPGGIFALSFDRYSESDGFGVMPKTGYFGHALNYVLREAKDAGFETIRTGEVEASAAHFVQLCFFRKPNGNDDAATGDARR